MKNIFEHFYNERIPDTNKPNIVLSLFGGLKDSPSMINYLVGEITMKNKLEQQPLEVILDKINQDEKVIVFVDDNVSSGTKLEESIGCFHKASTIFESQERIDFMNLAEKIGIQLFQQEKIIKNWPDELVKERSLGCGNSQKFIVFFYNVPTSTLPILWKKGTYNGKAWYPLFPRREKK